MSLEQLKNRIHELVDQFGKVDIVKFAESLGLKVFLAENGGSDFNAEINYEDETGEFEILVNAKHPYTRQRFSIAHEIAHYLLHKEQIFALKKINRGPKTQDNYQVEKEADRLAEEILMPEPLVASYFTELGLDKNQEVDSNIIRLFAQKFEVSPMMAAIRLRNLGYVVSLSYVA